MRVAARFVRPAPHATRHRENACRKPKSTRGYRPSAEPATSLPFAPAEVKKKVRITNVERVVGTVPLDDDPIFRVVRDL